MLKLLITAGPITTDYSHYVLWPSIKISERINTPSTMSFSLAVVDWKFRIPVERAYVRLISTLKNKSIFTGYISIAPTRNYLGLSHSALNVMSATGIGASGLIYNGAQIMTYDITATSDDYLLNIKAVPFIPAFINRTQGQILTDVAEALCPGFFDTSAIEPGDIVPYFVYDPKQSWSEIAKEFGDSSRFRYKARDKILTYVPYGDNFLGISYDEVTQSEGWFDPTELKTTILAVPVVNDVTVIGDAEGGNNHEDYYLGDGFTANLPLHHKVFHGASVVLAQESWNNQELNLQQWFLQDPGDNFDFSVGALNIISSPSIPFGIGTSFLGMNNGLELAGGLNLQHGEYVFDDESSGLIGGLYLDQTYAASGYLGGFNITSPPGVTTSASGAGGVIIQPTWRNVNVGRPVVSQPNHTYILQTVIHAPQYTRWTQTYRTVDGEEFGGGSSTMTGLITFDIQDYDIGAATGFYYSPVLHQSTVQETDLPAFAAYALINNNFLNITATNTLIAKMPLGGLSGLLGACGLYSPSGLVLPMLQSQWLWGVPPSGNYLNQPVPPTPAPLTVNLSPSGNQYYVGGVSTWAAANASPPVTSGITTTIAPDSFTAGWEDYGPGFTIITGAVSYTGGPPGSGLSAIQDIMDNSRLVYGDFDLIKFYSTPIDLSIPGSVNAGADTFSISYFQSQPLSSGLIIVFNDINGGQASYVFNFSPGSAFLNWITLTAPRSQFTTTPNFAWSQVVRWEMYYDNVPPPGITSIAIFLAGGTWTGTTINTVVPSSNFLSLLTDPLFNERPAAGELVGGWVYTGDTSNLSGPSITITSPSGGTYTGIIPLSVTATAVPPATMVSLTFKLDGTPFNTIFGAGPTYSTTLDTTTLTDSSHTIAYLGTDSNGVTNTQSVIILVNNGGGGIIAPSGDFGTALTTLSLSPLRDYEFGTGGNITNTSTLAAHFDPYGYAGTAPFGGEWERYQPFNSTNFVFTSSSLDLTATIPGGGGLFAGGIYSGQIFSQEVFQPGQTGHAVYAFEVRMKVPGVQGSWPASWIYTKFGTGGTGPNNGGSDASEIDNPEFFNANASGPFQWTGYTHGPGAGSDFYSILTNPPYVWEPGTDFSAGYHDYQLVWTNNKVYRYVDGLLVRGTDFVWTASGKGQLIVNLAVGSGLVPGLVPNSLGEFPIVLSLKHIKIWAG